MTSTMVAPYCPPKTPATLTPTIRYRYRISLSKKVFLKKKLHQDSRTGSAGPDSSQLPNRRNPSRYSPSPALASLLSRPRGGSRAVEPLHAPPPPAVPRSLIALPRPGIPSLSSYLVAKRQPAAGSKPFAALGQGSLAVAARASGSLAADLRAGSC
jgi:hypothetical protein